MWLSFSRIPEPGLEAGTRRDCVADRVSVRAFDMRKSVNQVAGNAIARRIRCILGRLNCIEQAIAFAKVRQRS